MNHDVERSLNVPIDDTPSALRRAAGQSQMSLPRREEQVHWQQQLLPEDRQTPPNSLSRPSLTNTLQRVIDQGRIVLRGFPSPLIPFTRLERALSELLDEMAPVAGPQVRIVVTGRPKTLKPAIQEQIYLIGREAFVNALRHAAATSIEAEIEYSPRRIRVVVRDNGCGIEQNMLTSGCNSGRGLRGMLDRARTMGARLQIWSKPRCGTEVELSLPFDSQWMTALNP